MIKKPLLVINFKAYEEGTGSKGLKIAKAAQRVSRDIILCPQTVDLRIFKKAVKNPIFAQSMDAVMTGAQTGKNTYHALKDAGASGVLINHSENRKPLSEIKSLVMMCREHGLKSIVCAQSLKWVSDISLLNPDYIAYEPPSLIGGDVSVTSAEPGVITKCVSACNGIPLLVGAGVKTCQDASEAIKLGASGVLVASGVIKVLEPKQVISKLYNNLKN